MQHSTSILEEELKKGEKLSVGWPWRLLVFSAVLFGATVLLYLGMSVGYQPYLNLRIKNLDQKVSSLTQTINEGEQQNLVNFYSQLVNIKDLIANRPFPSKVFDFLEKNTLSQVNYSSLNFSLEGKTLAVSGNAANYDALVQQLEQFRRAPEVDQISLEESKIGEGSIRFSIKLILKHEVFN